MDAFTSFWGLVFFLHGTVCAQAVLRGFRGL